MCPSLFSEFWGVPPMGTLSPAQFFFLFFFNPRVLFFPQAPLVSLFSIFPCPPPRFAVLFSRFFLDFFVTSLHDKQFFEVSVLSFAVTQIFFFSTSVSVTSLSHICSDAALFFWCPTSLEPFLLFGRSIILSFLRLVVFFSPFFFHPIPPLPSSLSTVHPFAGSLLFFS